MSWRGRTTDARGIRIHGWPVMAELEDSVAAHAGALIAIGGAMELVTIEARGLHPGKPSVPSATMTRT